MDMKWLKEIRAEKEMTQEMVALRADVARAAYSNIEIGVRRPSVEVAKRIGAVLGFDWTRFYEERVVGGTDESA